MEFSTWFAESHSEIPVASAQEVLRLAAEGATVPFIARYRKERTGNLDEVKIQTVIDAREKWDALLKRQTFIVDEIERQKKLTPELKDKILSTFQSEVLEDIYLPYKQKRKTKAALAKEAGLEPLADWIWNCGHGTEQPLEGQTLEIWAFTFRNEAKGFGDAQAVIDGAQDILVERLAEMQDLRQLVRDKTFKTAVLKTGKGPKPKPHSKYENYFTYHEPIQSLLERQNSHRYLAIRRGWIEEELTLSIGGKPDSAGPKDGEKSTAPVGDGGFEESLLVAFRAAALTHPDSPGAAVLEKAARLAFKAHVFSSIENEVHKALKEVADEVAIQVFSENVRKLLLSSPFGPKAVLGVDPGIRTGCKLAVVDDSGKYIASTVIHLQSDAEKEKARTLLKEVVTNGKIRAIAVGNGTAGRETEIFIRTALKTNEITDVPVVMVSESGASVYSASEVAREEFPDLDLTVRGAISIARRLQDPLAELVKVDPKSIGVGQYQHDISQPVLKRGLDIVVDSCVNQVGVNLNTASYHLLAHVSGIGPTLAKNIVEYRGLKGIFTSRQDLLEVPRFSQKAFEQAAGFLRIPEASNPLDNTGVHPERYPILEARAVALNKSVRDLMGNGSELLRKDSAFKDEVGEFTFDDILRELEKPGRDPRESFVPFQYRDDIHALKDVQPGMICPGIVTNVTAFGAFVDIGVHQDGLVHLSQLANRFVKDPLDVVSPGDRVQVKVLEIHLEKNQMSLSMKVAAKPDEARAPRERTKKPRGEPKPKQRPQPSANPGPLPKLRERPTPSANPGPLPSLKARPQPSSQQPQKRPTPKQAFNNAFAGLAGLREQLKARK